MTSDEAVALGFEHLIGAAATRAAPRVVRALGSPVARRGRAAVASAFERLADPGRPRGIEALLDVERHALTPAAVRVERGRSDGPRGTSEQTAVTVWFGEGPALPGVSGGGAAGTRAAVRMGAGVLGTAALAALAAAATRLAESPRHPRISQVQVEPRRLEAPRPS